MADFPAELSTGMVHGRFIVAVIDSEDEGQDPDVVPAQGKVAFKASVGYIPVPVATGGPVTVMKGPIMGVLDNDGYLCTPHPSTGEPMYRGVRLISTDDPDMAVTDWTWSADYRLEAVNGNTMQIPAHSFALPSGSEVDLTTLVKVPSSPGYGLPQAEAAVLRAEAAAIEASTSADVAVQGASTTDGLIAGFVSDTSTQTSTALSAAIAKSSPDPYSQPWDIVLPCGQSNAWETDYPQFVYTEPDQRVLFWDGTQAIVQVAKNDELGFAFARNYAREHLADGRKVIYPRLGYGETGFAGISVNGTWDRTLSTPKNRALETVATAQAMLAAAPAGSRIVALVWSQGENDRSEAIASGHTWYSGKLDDFFAWVRTSLSLPELPIIVMSQTPETIANVESGGGDLINRVHEDTPRRVQWSTYVYGPEGYSRQNNVIHFTTPGHTKRGEMASAALRKAIFNEPPLRPGTPLNLSVQVLGANASFRWEPPFQRVDSYLLEISTNYGATWQPVNLAHPMALSAEAVVTLGAEVRARIASVNDMGTSEWSPVAVGGGYLSATTPVPGLVAKSQFTADTLTVADGSRVTIWPDEIGSESMDNGTGATIQTENGHRYLSFNGTSDYLSDAAMSGVKTVMILAKAPNDTAAAGHVGVGPVEVRPVTGAGKYEVGPNPTTNYPQFTRSQALWSVWWITLDGTNRTFSINKEAPHSVAYANPVSLLRIGRNGAGTTYGALSVSAVRTYAHALDATQRATVVDELTAAYSGWLA